MPDENTVMIANETALKPRVFSSKRSLQVLGHRARPRAVIERHHEHADEHHRRDRADPVEVAGRDAVLGAGRGHADHFLRAQVRGEEGQPAIQAGIERPDRKKSSLVVDVAPERPTPMPSTNTKYTIRIA